MFIHLTVSYMRWCKSSVGVNIFLSKIQFGEHTYGERERNDWFIRERCSCEARKKKLGVQFLVLDHSKSNMYGEQYSSSTVSLEKNSLTQFFGLFVFGRILIRIISIRIPIHFVRRRVHRMFIFHHINIHLHRQQRKIWQHPIRIMIQRISMLLWQQQLIRIIIKLQRNHLDRSMNKQSKVIWTIDDLRQQRRIKNANIPMIHWVNWTRSNNWFNFLS